MGADNGRGLASDWSSMPDWITTQEAAEISGYHVNYIRRLMRQGKLKGRKAGVWWIDKASLRDYIELVEDLGGQKFQGTPTVRDRIE